MECEQNACGCECNHDCNHDAEISETEKQTNRRLFKIANLMKGLPAKIDSCAEKLETKGNCWEIITELHQVKHHIQEIKRELSDEPHFMHVFHDKDCAK